MSIYLLKMFVSECPRPIIYHEQAIDSPHQIRSIIARPSLVALIRCCDEMKRGLSLRQVPAPPRMVPPSGKHLKEDKMGVGTCPKGLNITAY